MITVRLYRKDLVDAGACDSHLSAFDRLTNNLHKFEMEWTPEADKKLMDAYPLLLDWLVEKRLIPVFISETD
jgi:hypothetical protein